MDKFFAIINDCADEEAVARQIARFFALFGENPNFFGVKHELEAASCLLGLLDGLNGGTIQPEGVVLVNVAPRNGGAKKWGNGVPFCHFKIDNITVVSTVGMVLSLHKKFDLVSSVHILDIPTVMSWAVPNHYIDPVRANYIIQTQFRSMEFIPLVASWIQRKLQIPSENVSGIEHVPDAPQFHVAYRDKFGNIKLTGTHEDMENMLQTGATSRFDLNNIFPYLSDVPDDGRLAFVKNGSSGFGYDHPRLMELVVNGGSAAEKSRLNIGDSIFK